MAKFKTTGSLQVEGMDLLWSIRHYGGGSSAYENLRGLSVSICLDSGKGKELIIDFPFEEYFFHAPRDRSEFESRLEDCVKEALQAGWSPDSRGKAFIHAVGES